MIRIPPLQSHFGSVFMLVLAAGLGLIALPAYAVTLTQPTSLFERPSVGSRQIQILESSAVVKTTGPEVSNSGLSFTPVTTEGKSGYVLTTDLAPEPVLTTEPKRSSSRIRFWVADGVGSLNSNANYLFNDFMFGAAVEFGAERRWVLGLAAEYFGSSEYYPDGQIMGLHRRSALIEAGLYLIPDRLSLKVRGGVSGVGVDSSSNGLIAQWTYGATLTALLAHFDRFGLGTQLNYSYTPSVSSGGWLYGSLNTAFGGTNAIISSANAISLQIVGSYLL